MYTHQLLYTGVSFRTAFFFYVGAITFLLCSGGTYQMSPNLYNISKIVTTFWYTAG